MIGLIIVLILLLVIQSISIMLYNNTDEEFWLVISGLSFACIIGIMIYILVSYGLL